MGSDCLYAGQFAPGRRADMGDAGRRDEEGRHPHQAAAERFFALSLEERYAKMAVPWGEPGHLEDEVVVTASRRAEAEQWPDRRKYTQELMSPFAV